MSNHFIRSFFSVIILLFIIFFYQSCTDNVLETTNTEEINSELRFTYMPNSANDLKSKEETSEFGCYVSIKNENSSWEFWSIYLHYPQEIVKKADASKARFKTRLKNPVTGEVEKIANCIIPGTEQAANMAKGLLMKNVKVIQSKTKDLSNDEGFMCPPGYSWGDEKQSWCINSDGEVSLPEMEIVAEYEDGPSGGGGEPYSPPDDGSSDTDSGGGGACYTCDPGDDPTDSCESTDGVTLNKMNCEETVTEIDLWEREIIDNELHPCMQDELDRLKVTNVGVGEIIVNFAISQLFPEKPLGELNWLVKDGELDSGINGETDPKYDAQSKLVTTTFDSDKFSNSTDLSVARTILHEAVHAYVVSVVHSDEYIGATASEKESLLGPNWINAFENMGHNFMAENYVSQIADALEAFGNSKGYSLGRQFYEDMSWGGLLSTPEFQGKSESEKVRIENVILIEQSGRDKKGDYKTQKGGSSGC